MSMKPNSNSSVDTVTKTQQFSIPQNQNMKGRKTLKPCQTLCIKYLVVKVAIPNTDGMTVDCLFKSYKFNYVSNNISQSLLKFIKGESGFQVCNSLEVTQLLVHLWLIWIQHILAWPYYRCHDAILSLPTTKVLLSSLLLLLHRYNSLFLFLSPFLSSSLSVSLSLTHTHSPATWVFEGLYENITNVQRFSLINKMCYFHTKEVSRSCFQTYCLF